MDYIIKAQSFPPSMKGSITLPEYSHAVLPPKNTFTDVVRWLKAKKLIKGDYRYEVLVDDSALR